MTFSDLEGMYHLSFILPNLISSELKVNQFSISVVQLKNTIHYLSVNCHEYKGPVSLGGSFEWSQTLVRFLPAKIGF